MNTLPTNYYLNNINNYNKKLDVSTNIIVNKYVKIIIEYLKFIIENIKINKANIKKFIIIRGFNTITNIFNNILYYTKNIDITYFYCQKAYFFYIEFINQIFEEEKMFLQLNSKDASVYVYKKIINEINSDIKKQIEIISDETKEKIDLVLNYIELYKTIIFKILENELENSAIINNIEIVEKISNKINNMKIEKQNLKILILLMDKLYLNTNITVFFEIIQVLIKKIQKNTNVTNTTTNVTNTITIFEKIKNNLQSEDFSTYINNYSPDKFIDWIIF